jgi:hypothetical protein
MKKRRFNFSNKLSYTLIAIFAIIFLGIGVYALSASGGDAGNPGHNINSIGAPTGCSSGQYLQWSGGTWSCATVTASTNYWTASGNNIANSNSGSVDISGTTRIGTTASSARLNVQATTNGWAIRGESTGAGSDTIGVYGYASGANSIGVNGYGFMYGGKFSGSTIGINVNSCTGCSVLAEMVPVAETPNNGDVMCTNPNTGKTEICKEDKSNYIKGIAQKFAESILRMGCSKTLDSKNGENSLNIGIMDVNAWQKDSECKGWYPIALSGLSEQTNVVCKSPEGKTLGYGDILVSSNVPGRLRPLDKDEDVKPYQIVGKADSICAPNKEMDSIKVWVQ